MSRLDLSSIPVLTGTGYPDPFAEAVNGRSKQALGDAGGLTQFGVNLVELQPGAASSQRHWHSTRMIRDGRLWRIDAGHGRRRNLDARGRLRGFPGRAAERPPAHQSRLGQRAVPVRRFRISEDQAHYPDIDLVYDGKTDSYAHRDGTPYPKRDTRTSTMPAAAASIETDEKTLDPRVFRADHGEQAGINPHEP